MRAVPLRICVCLHRSMHIVATEFSRYDECRTAMEREGRDSMARRYPRSSLIWPWDGLYIAQWFASSSPQQCIDRPSQPSGLLSRTVIGAH